MGGDGGVGPPKAWGPMGAIIGAIWGELVPYGVSRCHMGSIGAIWGELVPYGVSWYHMGSVGAIWGWLVPYRVCWYHMGSVLG